MNNNEIKEILELIGNACYYGKINDEKKEKYCDYITNLEETIKTKDEGIKALTEDLCETTIENEKLKKEKNVLLESLCMARQKYNNDKARYRRKAKVYKEKIDKAYNTITKFENWLQDSDLVDRATVIDLINQLQCDLKVNDYNKIERVYLDDKWIGVVTH